MCSSHFRTPTIGMKYDVVILIVIACYSIQNTESSGDKMACCMYDVCIHSMGKYIVSECVGLYALCTTTVIIQICACFWFVLKSCRSKSLAFHLDFGGNTRLDSRQLMLTVVSS